MPAPWLLTLPRLVRLDGPRPLHAWCYCTGLDPYMPGATVRACRLQERQPGSNLRGVQYTLLGLGDSVYAKFLGYPNLLNKK